MSGDRYPITDQNGLYFLTFTVVEWMDIFIRAHYKQIIVDDLNHCVAHKGMEIYSWCLMTSHMHLVARAKEGYRMSHFLRDFKKHSAMSTIHAISQGPESRQKWVLDKMRWQGSMDSRITQYKFWKEDNHAILLEPTQPEIIQQKVDYIHNNPVVEGIVEQPHEYLHSSARDYAGIKGLVNICFV